MMRYLDYCQAPPSLLPIATSPSSYSTRGGERLPNPQWRPFLGKRELGRELPYRLERTGDENQARHPVRPSSSFSFRRSTWTATGAPAATVKRPDSQDTRRRGPILHRTAKVVPLMQAAERLATECPLQHERSRFLICLMYACYLRISGGGGQTGFSPVMSQFRRDSKTGVWGCDIPCSKGGKRRTVAVPRPCWRRWQCYRTFSLALAAANPGEQTPLFVRHKAAAHGREQGEPMPTSGSANCATLGWRSSSRPQELPSRMALPRMPPRCAPLTPHSIRHTGIAHDINLRSRPLSHVQADAGHDSIDTTSNICTPANSERHESASRKPLDRLM